ncbi:YdgH/BhsA/McbA-like domain containing protein [Serratia sp. 22264]|uniref:YdgH/BhsA/McbA-like domain containing protein n=1 Tax=Serratia sp. 22264 TaxID=3453897 RepID=UPI003F82D4A6
MKFIKLFFLSASLILGVVSFGSLAATLLTAQEVKDNPGKYEKIGSITTTAEATSPMDARDKLSKMADKLGGQYYVIIAGREHGRFSAVAEVYKDKK